MVLPIVALIALTKGVREALPFLESITRTNPLATATHILEEARDLGLKFESQGAFRVVSQIKANLRAEELFQIGEIGDLPQKDAIGIAEGILKRDYAFSVTIRGYNPLTGEREERYVTIASNRLLSPLEVQNAALNLPSGNPGSQTLINTVVEPTGVVRSKYAR